MQTNSPQIKEVNLPDRADIAESKLCNQKRREYYLALKNAELFSGMEAHLQAKLDELNRQLLALHDARNRADECLAECDLQDKHLEQLLEEHDARVAERRAEQAAAKTGKPRTPGVPEVVMAAMRKAYPSLNDQQIKDLINKV